MDQIAASNRRLATVQDHEGGVKKLLAFYGTREIIAMFTRGYHSCLSWASKIQSTLHDRRIFILILYPSCAPIYQAWPLPFAFTYWNCISISRHSHVL
jgi:hypothetical protein